MFLGKSTSFRICKLIMMETGTYNPQYLRPYQTMFDGPTVANVTERVLSSGGARLDSATLSGITNSFISPSATPESIVNISNGWNEKRVRFLLEIECSFQVGGSVKSYIQGYTSYPGVTVSGAIAGDMDFYINSIVTTKVTYDETPLGMQRRETVSDNSHLLSSNAFLGATVPGQQHMLRPQDIYCYMQSSHLPGVFESGSDMVLDGRTLLRSEAEKSNRTNNLASNYAAKIIDGYIVGTSVSDFGQNELNILNRSRQEVSDPRAREDSFLMALAGVTGSGIVNHFRFSDLVKIDANVDNVTNFAVQGQTQRATVHTAGQTSEWHGSDITTVSATVLSQSVPALMMELMLSRLVFKSTNHDIQGKINTVIIDARSFSNLDTGTSLNVFKNRLLTEVLNNITSNNQIPYLLEMRIDLLGETWIELAIDNNPPITFVTPSFCDNLFVPVITANSATIQNLTSDFSNLVNNITEGMHNKPVGNLTFSSKV